MSVFWCIFYVAIMLLVGCAATVLVLLWEPGGEESTHRRSIAELLALVMSLGAGITGTAIFWLSVIGLQPRRGEISGLGLAAIAILSVTVSLRGRMLARQVTLPTFDAPLWRPPLLLPLPIL